MSPEWISADKIFVAVVLGIFFLSLFLRSGVTRVEYRVVKKKEDKDSEESSSSKEEKKTTKTVGGNFSWGGLLVALMLLIAIATGGFFLYQEESSKKEMEFTKWDNNYSRDSRMYFPIPGIKKGDLVVFATEAGFKIKPLKTSNPDPVFGLRIYLGGKRKSPYYKGDEITIPAGTRFEYSGGNNILGFHSEQKIVLVEPFKIRIE
ncbi:MAG: hypothetical protein R6V40_03170 [Candidatus Moraniibacteriota bacterium]